MPRMETVNLQVRVPAQLKRDADMLFRSMGLETGDAVRVFLTQAVGCRAMPFEIAEPKDIN
ncbi:MAG: type II toxin-antitoxin system RelB/DinJ family antitoxin, partial [Fretibacterium sp.]